MTTEPTLPLLHPTIRAPFTWGARQGKVHAQRSEPGSKKPDGQWFYLELPDGSVHEVQFSRIKQVLQHPPVAAATFCIAAALQRESDQRAESLLAIAKACGL